MQLEIGTSPRRYLPASRTAGLARSRVRGKRRVPAPPPRMTAITWFTWDNRLVSAAPRQGHQQCGDRCRPGRRGSATRWLRCRVERQSQQTGLVFELLKLRVRPRQERTGTPAFAIRADLRAREQLVVADLRESTCVVGLRGQLRCARDRRTVVNADRYAGTRVVENRGSDVGLVVDDIVDLECVSDRR